MEVNPFAVVKESTVIPEPLAMVKETVPAAVFGGATGQEKLRESVQQFQKSAMRAASSRRAKVLGRIVEIGTGLWRKLMEYARQAVDMAMHKFVIELCAMIISAVFAALSRKGYGHMDISTKDVMYRGAGGGTSGGVAGAGTPSSQTNTNPFASWSSPRPATGSAW